MTLPISYWGPISHSRCFVAVLQEGEVLQRWGWRCQGRTWGGSGQERRDGFWWWWWAGIWPQPGRFRHSWDEVPTWETNPMLPALHFPWIFNQFPNGCSFTFLPQHMSKSAKKPKERSVSHRTPVGDQEHHLGLWQGVLAFVSLILRFLSEPLKLKH